MLRTAIFLAALIIAAAPLHAAKTYKWTDANGKVHYGSQPPQGVEAQELRVPGAGSTKGGAAPSSNAPTQAEPAADASESQGDDDQRGTPDPDWMTQQCEGARKNLEIFTDASPNQRFRRPDGTVVRYTEEEIAAERAEAQEFVEQYCSNDGKQAQAND